MTITVERTQLEDGAQLGMLRGGPAEGKPVVLLHGIPTGSELWREIIPDLADQGYQCFAVDLPTLLIWGSHDRFQPWEKVGVRLRTLLPNPKVTLIERAGHFHVLERPQAFVEALTDWRQST